MTLADDRGTTIDSYIENLLAGKGSTLPASVLLGAGGSKSVIDQLIGQAQEFYNKFYEQSLVDDRAAQAFSEEMERARLALEREKFEFGKQDTMTDRLLQAAGLATGPTGAIQLAYLARNQGAPQDQIRDIFQNLPFVQALLAGQALPGFGVPEQLGGPSERVSQTGGGGLFGVNLPGLNAVTERQFSQLSTTEQQFLGALYQSEFGISTEEALQTIQNSFLPTTNAQPISISR